MKNAFLAALGAAIVFGLVGCSSGETTQADVDQQVQQMQKQAPSGLGEAAPSDDVVQMGGGGTMPKGVRGQQQGGATAGGAAAGGTTPPPSGSGQ
jgi:hypothetical protein